MFYCVVYLNFVEEKERERWFIYEDSCAGAVCYIIQEGERERERRLTAPAGTEATVLLLPMNNCYPFKKVAVI